MRNPVHLRALLASAVVVAIVAPIIAQAWPVCGDEGMTAEMRCAGLWAAGCCDYSAARERIQGSDDGKARPPEAVPGNSSPCHQYLARPGCPERVPIARALAAHPEPGVSSTILRL